MRGERIGSGEGKKRKGCRRRRRGKIVEKGSGKEREF